MDTHDNFPLKLENILFDNNFAKFGDSLVNFLYNSAIYEATKNLQGVKVWDQSLAEACRNSPLRSYIGGRKNAGELGDAVEAFLGYLYIKNPLVLPEMITTLSRFIHNNINLYQKNEKELCSTAFSHLVNYYCEKNGISI
ncbi:MAG: ribonuclease III family protein [Candidatus Heimdallarchaeaceae archaeon]